MARISSGARSLPAAAIARSRTAFSGSQSKTSSGRKNPRTPMLPRASAAAARSRGSTAARSWLSGSAAASTPSIPAWRMSATHAAARTTASGAVRTSRKGSTAETAASCSMAQTAPSAAARTSGTGSRISARICGSGSVVPSAPSCSRVAARTAASGCCSNCRNSGVKSAAWESCRTRVTAWRMVPGSPPSAVRNARNVASLRPENSMPERSRCRRSSDSTRLRTYSPRARTSSPIQTATSTSTAAVSGRPLPPECL